MKKFLFLLAMWSFTTAKSQSIAITQPNGSEILFTCQSYTIMWNQSGNVSNYWNIDYSLDGGLIWSSVTSNYLATNGRFIWTVPSVQSSIVLVRVKDALNASTTDQSNNVFTINIPVTLSSPNGGEVWQAASTRTISWVSTGLSNFYTINSSTNGGLSWTNIASNYSTTSNTYTWVVPTTPSYSCLIQIYNQSASCAADQSNSTFTISPPTPVLISPNGGQFYNVGCNLNITWNTSTFYSNVSLEFSTNNGFSWTPIVSNLANTGSYSWNVPNLPSTTCLIRAYNTADYSIGDISDVPFTINSPLTVVSPNGGETWNGCGTYTVNWTKSPCLGGWTLYYSTDNGANWNAFAFVNDNGSPSQTYVWNQLSNGITSTQALIRVVNSNSPTVYFDQSDATYSITPSNDVTVLSPNGGQTITGGNNHVITWSVTPNTSGSYRVQYSDEQGSTNLVSATSANSYTWTTLNAAPTRTNCRIYVYDNGNNCKYDISDNSFTVTYVPPTPTLYVPNGGQTVNVGCAQTVSWNPSSFFSNVNVYFSSNLGVTWTTLITNISNSGSYNFSLPNVTSTACLVKVANFSNTAIYDVSDAPFTIQAPLTVLSPNGGENWAGCGSYSVTWAKTPCIGSWSVSYSTDNGSNWQLLNIINDNGAPTQTYVWNQLSNSFNSNQMLMRVSSTNSPTVYSDVSNSVFTTTPSSDITVLTPNGGQSITGGNNLVITWSNTPNTSGSYRLVFSSEAGGSTIVSNTSGNSYTWTTPNAAPTKTLCRIYVSDASNTCREDFSDNTFTVTYTPPTPTLQTPNGGELLSVGCTYGINWIQSSFYSNVDLYYSINNGTSWNLITSNTTNDGNYLWTVPNTVSGACLIKASNVADANLYDISNSTFTINPALKVNSPNGSETWYGCSTYTITWTKSPCLGQWYVYYSSDGGNNWNMLSQVNDNGQPQQTYTWPASNFITSSQMLARVTSVSNPTLYTDDSDGTFTLTPSVDITVLTPNGGQNFTGGNNYVITWTNTANTSGLYRVDAQGVSGANVLVASTSAHSFTWTIPNSAPSSYFGRIYVYDVANTCKQDYSDNTFTVNYVPPTPTLLIPNGGQTLSVGCSQVITWNAAGFYSGVDLFYSVNNGLTWSLFASNVQNTGTYNSWTVPNLPSSNCLIKAANNADQNVFDISNAPFTIAPAVKIISPNGGENLTGCNNYNITWEKTNCVTSTWSISLSTNGGISWNSLTTVNNNGQPTQSYLWQAPNNMNTTQLRFRVNNYNNPTLHWDDSDANISVSTSTEVTLISPNGGQIFAGDSITTITWTNTSNTTGLYRIYYGHEGGLATSVSNLTGNSYTWTVPNTAPTRTAAYIRIQDQGNTCREDISDNTFTVTYIPVTATLTTPNGGELIDVNCTYTITWIPSSFFSNPNLYYSVNNGATWNTIQNGVSNTGSYVWTVPNLPGKFCLVKATNSTDQNYYDISNATFTINPAVRVVSPNGLENWNGCTTYSVTWEKTNCASGTWSLSYSSNSGNTWNNIATVNNNGLFSQSYSWQAPNTITSSQMRVRVMNTNFTSYVDESDLNYSLAPNSNVSVISPNGGETLTGCNTQTITFSKTDCAGFSWIFSYSTNNGLTWNTFASANNNGLPTQTFTWQPPNNIVSSQMKIRVANSVDPNLFYDDSNAPFSLIPHNDLALTSPNGGQSIAGGSLHVITWTNSSNTSGFFDLAYFHEGGSTTLGTNITGNSYTWSIPNTAPTRTLASIRVMDVGNTCKQDYSDNTFTVNYVPPIPFLLTPNGPPALYSGTFYNITWNTSSFYSNVNLYYSLDNGVTWVTIVTNSPNDGGQGWTLPIASSTACLVKAANTADPNVFDISDNVFTILPPVLLITPNGDNGITEWRGCTVTSITFDRSPAWSSYSVSYSLNNGVTWNTINSSFNTSANPATLNWNIPNSPTGQALVRVQPVGVAYSDQSDNTFTITKPVTIIQPNFGGVMQVGSVYPIKWSSDGISNIYDIFYSINGGASYLSIASGYTTSTNTYSWIVPNNLSTNCKIFVRDNINTCKSDTSDLAFVIQTAAPAITLLYPNGADTLRGCSTHTLFWTDALPSGLYNLSYSSDAGINWQNIITSYSTSTHSYNWQVPNSINSSNVLLRVQMTNTLNVSDLSDALVIVQNRSLTTTPSASNICSGTPVQLTAVGGANFNWSPSTALSATNISNPVASPSVSTIYTVQSISGSCVLTNTVSINVTGITSAASLTISAQPSATVCAGSLVTFSASPIAGGQNPVFQWKVNGTSVGSSSPTFPTINLSNNDVVSCSMLTTYSCALNNSAFSNSVAVTINQTSSASVNVAVSPSNSVCAGTPVSFSASSAFAGSTPSYQWKVNGLNQASGTTFTTSSLSQNDVVNVVMTTTATCIVSSVVPSPNIPMTIVTVPTMPSPISQNTTVCSFSPYNFSVSPVFGAVSYSWNLPSGWSGASSSSSIGLTTFTNGGVVSVQALNACGLSPARTMALQVAAPSVSVNGNMNICAQSSATLLATGSGTAYSWSSGQSTGIAIVSPTANTNYTVSATDINGCLANAVAVVTVNPLPPVSVSGNLSICAGNTTTLTVSGAQTYTWSNATTLNSLTVAPAVNSVYGVTGTGSNGCQKVAFVTVTVNATPTVNISGSSGVCAGSTVTLTASGGSSYLWDGSSPGSSLVISPTVNTSYSVVATDINGCNGTAIKSITINPLPVISTSGNTVICGGQNLLLNATGALTYTWTGGVLNNVPFVPAASNVYSVNATDVNGCRNTAAVSVTVQPAPSVSITATNPVVCAGYTTSLQGSGALSYTWSGGISDNTAFTPLSTTSYTLTGEGPNGCTNLAVKTITVNALPAVVANASPSVVCIGQNVFLTGAGASTYTWSGGHANNVPFQPSVTAIYSVTGTDLNGCVNGGQVTVAVNPLPNLLTSSTSSAICLGSSVALVASGANTYSWSAGVINGSPFSPASTSNYTVTGSDINGCVKSATHAVIVYTLPVLSIITSPTAVCAGNSASLIGSGALIYQWSGGISNGVPFTPSASAVYTLTGTDANGCQNKISSGIIVNQLPNVVAHVTSSTVCQGLPDTFFGSGAATYTWTGGVTNNIPFVPSTTGSYSVTGTDVNGCRNSSTITVTVVSLPVVTASIVQAVTCFGGTTAVNAAGALSYAWSGGIVNGVPFVPPVSATYSVTGTDVNGCSNTAVMAVTVNQLPTITAIATKSVICRNEPVTLSGSGGLSYVWSGGISNGIAFSPTATSIYSVTGTDGNGCQKTVTTTVTVNQLPIVSASVTTSSVCLGQNTTFFGAGAISYTWTGGISNNVPFSPTTTSIYSVTGSDQNGCTASSSASVVVLALPNVNASIVQPIVCFGGTTAVNASGANTYVWTGGLSNGITFTPSASSSYTVTGTDVNGCTSKAQTSVAVNQLPNVGTTVSSTVICQNQQITLAGTGAVNYIWSGGITNNVPFTASANAVYTVTGTDANGCSKTSIRSITVSPSPTLSASSSSAALCYGLQTVLTATGALTYTWSHGVTNGVSFTPSVSANYTVTGSAVNGCTSTANVIVTVNPLPNVSGSVNISGVCSGSQVIFTGIGASNYQWSNGIANGVPYTPLASSVFSVTGINTNGCSNSATVSVSVYSLPIVAANTSSTTICFGNTVTLSGGGAQIYNWTGGVTNNAPFAPSATGSYTVTGTNTTGCSGTAIRTITVLPAPPVTASVTNSVVCSGDQITLTGGGALIYAWSGGASDGIPFSPGSSAIYSVTGTAVNGCTNTAMVTVSVNPSPTVTALATSTAVCTGSSVTLSGGGASTYAWSGGISNGLSFIPTATSVYTVTGTTANGCVRSSTVSVSVLPVPNVSAISSASAVCAGSPVTLTGQGAQNYVWSGNVNNGIQFNPIATAGYTVTGSNGSGCQKTATIAVIVYNLPAVTANATKTLVCAGQLVTLTGAGALTYSWTGGVNDNVAFAPITTAIYTVTGTDINGCQNTASKMITVNQLPLITAAASNTFICAGASVSLSASGANTYTWAGGASSGTAFFPNMTATYTVAGTNSNGCVNTATALIAVNPLPVLTITGRTGKCIGEGEVTFVVSGANTYLWNTGEVSPSITSNVTITTNFTVTGTDQNGCIAAKAFQLTVDNCTGITETEQKDEILLYPNPGFGNYVIKTSREGKAIVSNSVGQILLQMSLVAEDNELDLTPYNNGVYFVTIIQPDQTRVVKVIKQ